MQPYPLLLLVCASAVLTASTWANTPAASPTNPPSLRERNIARVHQMDDARIKDYLGRPEFMVKPGLLADRTGRVVHVAAESIHLNPGDPVEFPLVTQGSGKDYEALAVSFSSALDLHEALQFIGLTAGRGVDASRLQFWPKGDRVKVVFHYTDTGSTAPAMRHIPVERLIHDTRTSKTLPETGFTFTGSQWEPGLDPATGKVYAADAFSPGAIVSIYNESSTVLDVPKRVSQNEVYTFQTPNPDYLLPSNQLIEITLEPFFKDNKPHHLDLSLRVAPATDNPTNTDLLYSLHSFQNGVINTNQTVNGLLAALERLGVQEVFVTVRPDGSTPLASLQKMAGLLYSLDNENGIRIEAPPPGEPYFKAFLPNERHRKREDRPAQAAELHLSEVSGIATGVLVWVDSEWKGDDSSPVFRETRITAATPEVLSSAIAAKEEVPSVMLVFAPATLRYGVLRDFLAPILKKKMILYVFKE